MGMGEPAHNLDKVLEAIELLGTAGGDRAQEPGLLDGRRPRAFERLLALPAGTGPAGARAVAAHHRRGLRAPAAAARASHRHRRDGPKSAERYARASGYPTQYQWTLIDGVNDGDAEIDAIARLLAGRIGDHESDPVQRGGGAALPPPAGRALRRMAPSCAGAASSRRCANRRPGGGWRLWPAACAHLARARTMRAIAGPAVADCSPALAAAKLRPDHRLEPAC